MESSRRQSEGDDEASENIVLWEDALNEPESDMDWDNDSPHTPMSLEYHRSGLQYIPGQSIRRYNAALKNLILIRSAKRKKGSLGVDEAGFWSYITNKWLTKYIYKAYKQGINFDDIPEVSPYDSAEYCVQRLDSLWLDEVATKGIHSASLFSVTWKFVRTRVIVSMVLVLISYLLAFISSAFFLRYLVDYATNPDAPYSEGITWAVFLTLCELLRVTIYSHFWTINYRTAVRLRSACMTLMYKKILRLHSLGEQSVGEIINLFSSDSDRIFHVIPLGTLVCAAPLAFCLIMFYLAWQLSLWAVLGFCSFFLIYPMQHFFSFWEGRMRKRAIVITDQRLSLISEIINSIKTIKVYAWTSIFSEKVFDLWRKEINFVKKAAYFESLGSTISTTGPVIASIIIFLAHTAAGYELTAAQAFTVLSLCFRMITNSLNFTRDGLRSLINYRITLKRLKRNLVLYENKVYLSNPVDKLQNISVANASFSRYVSTQETTKTGLPGIQATKASIVNEAHDDEELDPNPSIGNAHLTDVLTDISFSARKNQLVGVCGEVGSGKTTLLLAILGQVTMTKGKLCRQGSCAYVAQQPWLLNATFKENILFGEKFQAKKYFRTLFCCSLNEDVNMLPGGDETEIGEKGLNLSGGQKQRISIARAAYSNRDIYLFDDPLSAVDNRVANHIFNKCIKQLLKEKTVVFVTHRVEFLSQCDSIYVMKSGTICGKGTYDELIQSNDEFKNLMASTKAKDQGADVGESGEATVTESPTMSNGACGTEILPGGVLTTNEKVDRGSVRLDTFLTYIKAAGGLCVFITTIFVMFLNSGTVAFSSWWLAYWVKSGEVASQGLVNTTEVPLSSLVTLVSSTEVPSTEPVETSTPFSFLLSTEPEGILTQSDALSTMASNFTSEEPPLSSSLVDSQVVQSYASNYQLVYGLTILLIILTNLLRASVFTNVGKRASTYIHSALFNKVLKGPMQFFETTPSGRINNLFSKDIDEIENQLPVVNERIMSQIWQLLFAVFSIAIVFPYFIIPLVIFGIVFYTVTQIFRVSVRDLKRLDNYSRSPIFSNVTTTLLGLDTIQAFKKEKDFFRKFTQTYDRNTTCFFMYLIAGRWVGFRLDVIAVLTVAVTSGFVIFLHGYIPAAMAGLAITYAATISGAFQFTVRMAIECEGKFLSVERVSMYLSGIETEGGHGPKGIPRPSWPELGSIRFSHVSFCYRLGLQPALNDITLKISPAEKIGVVGRTGSGKSSLLSALFRLVEISNGHIKIDDLDISTLDLEILRSRLTIIPQDPVLFQGTVRSNLDPKSIHTDAEVWSALEKTSLKNKVSSMDGGLSAAVVSGGINFSGGEKQLMCLARVLLRKSKIILFDEATSGIDPETEKFILNTIKTEFKESTVLMIAHRLDTILSCDRILVMSNGRIAEFDEPSTLINNENSALHKMINLSAKSV